MQKSDNVKTKIVVTLGPQSDSPDAIEQLINAGTNVFRLNFSHGTYDEHKAEIENIRDISERLGKEVSIMQDLQGPKIRLGKIEGNSALLKDGQDFTLTDEDLIGNSSISSITFGEVINDVKVGESIFINDGLVKLKVKNILPHKVITEVVEGGIISDHKGLNFPETRISVSAFTDKDKQDLVFGLENDVDMIALSFVKSHVDIKQFKEHMNSLGKNLPVVSKVEKWEAVEDLEAIIDESSAVMVARGDLGVELPVEKVPIIQKRMIALANSKAKPVITATQMLNSMVENPTPTRAEVNDIANAIFDGTDAVMLSNETAVGKFPIESVKMMRRIIVETESSEIFNQDISNFYEPVESGITDAIAYSVKETAKRSQAKLIIAATESGKTASLISKYKPDVPVLALTSKTETLRLMNLKWDVVPCLVKPFTTVDEILSKGPQIAYELGFLSKGDVYIIVCGTHTGVSGSTNLFKVDSV
ncbi:MAG: pyruvate kinase [Caldisericaceae bacterium]